MITVIVVCLVLITNLTPLNLALTLTLTSITLRVLAYRISLSAFPSAIILISFSSGTMILFCYCAIITNYIQKSSKRVTFNLILMLRLPIVITSRKRLRKIDSVLLIKTMSSSTIICLAIRVVILRLVCINKTMYKKDKPLKISY